MLNEKMRTSMASAVFLVLAFLGSAMVAPTVQAGEPVYNCTDGCYAVTCDASGDCKVYHCDLGGCAIIASFRKPDAEIDDEPKHGLSNRPHEKRLAPGDTNDHAGDVAYAKVCAKEWCDIYRLSASSAAVIGTVANADDQTRRLIQRDQTSHAK